MCPPLSNTNGRIDYEKSPGGGKYPFASRAYFSCNSGFTLFSFSGSYCYPSGDWDTQPLCGSKQIPYFQTIDFLSSHFYQLLYTRKMCNVYQNYPNI